MRSSGRAGDARQGARQGPHSDAPGLTLSTPPRDPAAASHRETASERRRSPRQRTRLRSGKIVDLNGRFLSECTIYDLSAAGSRIRHPGALALPSQFQLYDDQSGLVHHATVLWRNGNESGLSFKPQPLSPRAGALASQMRRKFYAMRR